MGLFQKACETYDCFEEKAGVYEAGKTVLAPIAHKTQSAGIEITINADGQYLSARAIEKEEPKIVIPVTEESAGRTSGKCAHPLCDNLDYLSDIDSEKHSLYIEQLSEWESSEYSTPKLTAILKYIKRNTILSDLSDAGLIQFEGGKLKGEKQLVRWVVNGLGEGSGPCWTDKILFESFAAFYINKKADDEKILCMISGKNTAKARQHLKGVVSKHGNAKLISSNDVSGFTFRGRFTEDIQALTVGYEASQKAHNALKWIVDNQGVSFGNRIFICWNPQGFSLPKPTSPFLRKGVEAIKYPTDYKKQLLDTLNGWKNELPIEAGVVIAAFDAATSGRLSVAYYNELSASDFLKRLYEWDISCCWEYGELGIASPALSKIISFAYGVERNGKFQLDDAIYAQHMQRIIASRIEGAKMRLDIEQNLVNKCSRMGNYEEKLQREILFVTCAVIRKYYLDNLGREWNMALDKSCKDRSYLFGRLLAIADIVEKSTYGRDENRETNAMRLQAAFAQHPMAIWRVLEERIKPYYARLNPGLRGYYKKMTEEIIAFFLPDDAKLNSKLDDVYLLGYYHQKAYRNDTTQAETKE